MPTCPHFAIYPRPNVLFANIFFANIFFANISLANDLRGAEQRAADVSEPMTNVARSYA